MPERATGHAEVAERLLANRRRGTELAETPLAAAEAVVSDDAALAVASHALSARLGSDYTQTARIQKAGKPVVLTSSDTSVVR